MCQRKAVQISHTCLQAIGKKCNLEEMYFRHIFFKDNLLLSSLHKPHLNSFYGGGSNLLTEWIFFQEKEMGLISCFEFKQGINICDWFI